MFDSLSANSYGIYIVHYPFVAWLQFALLHASLTGTEKWALVAIAAYAASWLSTAAARRLPGVARII
jgi:glucan biosynthesis protein C